jgi:hypothetical protein
MNIYLELTRAFNTGALRAILSSGQAVVLHKLAVMSKDGDWILRENDEDLRHILDVLTHRNAHYRFGAPLDIRWLSGGWSAHFEFQQDTLRIRTDFVTRPPRLPPFRLAAMWREHEGEEIPFVGIRDLVDLKKTNREKDYAVIGELARLARDPADQMLTSRSARDLIRLAAEHPAVLADLISRRPVLAAVSEGQDKLEAKLDEERRLLIRANEKRLHAYMEAAEPWADIWPTVEREVADMPLLEAHSTIVSRAEGILPFEVEELKP